MKQLKNKLVYIYVTKLCTHSITKRQLKLRHFLKNQHPNRKPKLFHTMIICLKIFKLSLNYFFSHLSKKILVFLFLIINKLKLTYHFHSNTSKLLIMKRQRTRHSKKMEFRFIGKHVFESYSLHSLSKNRKNQFLYLYISLITIVNIFVGSFQINRNQNQSKKFLHFN